jgi:hypothetical protein
MVPELIGCATGHSHRTETRFFTSDRHHLPWHIKSLFLNILFDQGILGVFAVLLLSIAAVGEE